jgi:predicted nucleic acid-binding protein
MLFAAPVRDTVLRAAGTNLLDPKWSAETLDEMVRNLVASGRMSKRSVERLVSDLTGTFTEATVTDYAHIQTTLTNHPKDRHVLAAAIVGKAEVIVTPNLRDFGEDALSPYGIRAVSPDNFLLRLLEVDADTMHVVIDMQWRALQRPPLSRDQVLDALGVIAPKFAAAMRTPRG